MIDTGVHRTFPEANTSKRKDLGVMVVAALLLLAAVAGFVATAGLTAAARHPVTPVFDDLLVALAGWTLLACAGWLVLLCGAALGEAVTSGRVRATGWVPCPPRLRRALVLAVGLAATTAAPVAADDGPVRGLPLPERPLSGPVRVHPAAGPRPEPEVVVVRFGDSLWRIAEATLPPEAGAARVQRYVHRLHELNRGVVGPDPDHVEPGQRLALPTTEENR
jgi:hypothetical protein